MITMCINLDKWGLGTDVSTLCALKIWNTGTGTNAKGNYKYEIRGKSGKIMKKGEILNHPRNTQHVILLVQKVINDAYPLLVKH